MDDPLWDASLVDPVTWFDAPMGSPWDLVDSVDLPAAITMLDAPIEEVLVDRFVPVIDEIGEVIEEDEDLRQAVFTMTEAVRHAAPSERQRLMDEQESRYRDVEERAAKIVRTRKIHRPGTTRKLPAAFVIVSKDHYPVGEGPLTALATVDSASSTNAFDSIFCSEALADVVDIELARIKQLPKMSNLNLRVSWPLDSRFRNFPPGGFIINNHDHLFLIYVGPYHSALSRKGFYLVYNAKFSSVSVLPPLLSQSLSGFTHCNIGTGGAIRLGGGAYQYYIVVELFLRRNRGLISNKATLFRTLSPSSFDNVDNPWMEKEVVLPLPSKGEEHTSSPSYTFCADLVFSVGDKGICWVDLLEGILMCDDILAHEPKFRFIELPTGTSVKDGIHGRGNPVAHRSMSCLDYGTALKFVTMNGYGKYPDHEGVTINSWFMPVSGSEWEELFSFRYGDLRSDSALNLDLPQLVPTYPMLSLEHDHIMYITAIASDLESNNSRPEDDDLESMSIDSQPEDDLESINVRPQDIGRYVLSIDMRDVKVLSSFKLPDASGRLPVNLFPSIAFGRFLNKMRLHVLLQQKHKDKSTSSSSLGEVEQEGKGKRVRSSSHGKIQQEAKEETAKPAVHGLYEADRPSPIM